MAGLIGAGIEGYILLREGGLASARRDSMSSKTVTLAPVEFASGVGACGQAVLRIIHSVADGAVGFFSSLQAAQSVLRRAEHLRMRSNEELVRAGLSRQDIPAELLREFDRCRGR